MKDNYITGILMGLIFVAGFFTVSTIQYNSGYDNAILDLRQDAINNDCLTCRCQCGEASTQWYNTTEELTTKSLYYKLAVS